MCDSSRCLRFGVLCFVVFVRHGLAGVVRGGVLRGWVDGDKSKLLYVRACGGGWVLMRAGGCWGVLVGPGRSWSVLVHPCLSWVLLGSGGFCFFLVRLCVSSSVLS